jgi:DNA-binding winged helix-turn-helix (wHTH) protein/tetratricopeptide (TPR) repeat protein
MATGANQKIKELYEFGPFRVDPDKQTLLRDGERVALTPKSLQLLLVLLRRHNQIVTKDELMKAVWPDTFVEETNLTRNVFALRKALGETEQNRYIITVPGQGYRFAEDVCVVSEPELTIVAASHSKLQVQIREARPWARMCFAAVILLAIASGAARFFMHRSTVLTEKDTVVLADFANSTGDPVFDGTLRQGMAVQLEQSPFLSLISDQRIQQTLRLMGQQPDARLTPEIAHDLCQRTQSAAVISASIAKLGSQYVLGLKAVSCRTGDALAEEQETADGKETILRALDNAAIKLRQRLGESLSSIKKFDTPLQQATTPSLEALQAYTLGRKMVGGRGEYFAALPFFQQAIRIDPNFAMAYAAMGSAYVGLGESMLGAEDIRKAYELHAPLSQPESLYIESTYYHYVTGNLEKARQVYELWGQTFPEYPTVHLRLWVLYAQVGQLDKALAEIREAIRLDPSRAIDYAHLVASYMYLDQLEEARTTAQQALAKQLDSPILRIFLYRLAFLENDAAGMAIQAQWAAGKPGVEDELLEQEADTAAYIGQLRKSRDFSHQAMTSAIQAQKREKSTVYNARGAVREALLGNMKQARLRIRSAPSQSAPRDAEYAAALALALAGDTVRAQLLADDLAKRFAEDTIVRFNYLPSIYAQIALSHRQTSRAIELLQAAIPYELGAITVPLYLCPIYLRGSAYLDAHQGGAAVAEFQKIVDHRGIAKNHLVGALAQLQLGRAYAMIEDKAKSKSAYQDFLNLWKNADSDVPILKQAKTEYAKLQ